METTNTTNPERITNAADLLAAYAAGRSDFCDAVLTGANLTGADLSHTDLRGADLRDAHLSHTDLTGADLTGAVLSHANLTDADLTGAVLTGAVLTGAVELTLAQLVAANTTAIRDDLYAALAYAPSEVPALLETLRAGRIDGSTYNGGECACLAGTIARLTHDPHADRLGNRVVTLACGLPLDPSSPREVLFAAIRPGDTPENHPVAAFVEGLLVAWLAEHPQPATTTRE